MCPKFSGGKKWNILEMSRFNSYNITIVISLRTAESVSIFRVGIGIRYFYWYFFYVGSVLGIVISVSVSVTDPGLIISITLPS